MLFRSPMMFELSEKDEEHELRSSMASFNRKQPLLHLVKIKEAIPLSLDPTSRDCVDGSGENLNASRPACESEAIANSLVCACSPLHVASIYDKHCRCNDLARGSSDWGERARQRP